MAMTIKLWSLIAGALVLYLLSVLSFNIAVRVGSHENSTQADYQRHLLGEFLRCPTTQKHNSKSLNNPCRKQRWNDLNRRRETNTISGGTTLTSQRKLEKETRARSEQESSQNQKTQQLSAKLDKMSSVNETVAACLLIRDDNAILSEWIAYHYQVLGLRHLIVAVDPFSLESPTGILQNWRQLTDMKIQDWSDRDYMPATFLQTGQCPPQEMQRYLFQKQPFPSRQVQLEVSNHRYRQRVFLTQCLRQFQRDGRSWVLHSDTDEFIVPSKLLRRQSNSSKSPLLISSMEESNSVLGLLQQAVKQNARAINYPCVPLLRVLFGAQESTQPEEVAQNVPTPFDAKTFETLRWRYHGNPYNISVNGNPKVLLDVSAIPSHYFRNDSKHLVFSIHRPLKKYCRTNKALSYGRVDQQPIGMNHYLGSWERYSGRKDDKRRSREIYNTKAAVNHGFDDGARLWLQGFQNNVGSKVAQALLGTAHLLENQSEVMK